MNKKSIDFLEIKKGKVSIDWSYDLNNKIRTDFFPQKKLVSVEIYKNTIEYRMYSVIECIGNSIFRNTTLDFQTWYLLNGKDTHSLVSINHTRLLGRGMRFVCKFFSEYLERKIIESGKTGVVVSGKRIINDFTEVQGMFNLIHDGNILYSKMLFNNYFTIVFDKGDLTQSEVVYEIRDDWEVSKEFSELKESYFNEIKDDCGTELYSKKESHLEILNYELTFIDKNMNEIDNDKQFIRKMESYQSLISEREKLSNILKTLK
jgi:hypothetical protein